MIIRHALIYATDKLTLYLENKVSAAQEARWLLSHALGINNTQLLSQSQRTLTVDECAAYEGLLNERIHNHKPLAYILGSAPFCGLNISVQAPVLIPRHETEELVQHLITLLKPYTQQMRILDVCTGTGAIALGLAHNLPHAYILGTDISEAALDLAQKNKYALGLCNITFMHADLYGGLPKNFFDLIISNPPYLSTAEWEALPPDVKKWESPIALTSGESGMELYECIITDAHDYLRKNSALRDIPELILEHGSTQQKHLSHVLRNAHFDTQVLWKDSFGKDRAILAKRSTER